MSDTIKITTNLSLKIETTKNNNINYIFIDNETGSINRIFENKGLPATLSKQKDVIKYIINLKGWEEEYLPKIIDKKVNEELIPDLIDLYNKTQKNLKTKEKAHQKAKARSKRKVLANGKQLYETIEHPVSYIKELCDWTSAGETRNILFALNAYISQICLKSGINVIIEGDAANGKDHIRRAAFQFLPEGCVVMEKNVTQAVIFRRSEQDRQFYDGKIVYYGDMGGSKDMDNMEDSINIMKELQTEHYMNKPTNISEDGGWNVVELTLEGTPSLTFTTVPNSVMDTQILSRGVTLMPRNDNKREFFTFKAFMDFKGETYDYVQNVIYPAIDNVKDMIEYLCDVSEDLIMLNPYYESLQSLLVNSDFYKRDYDKYRNLLYSVTLLNSANNITEYDGKKYLAVTSNDLQLYFELINDYIDIASHNLTKGAMKVLEEFNKLDSTLQGAEELPEVDSEFELTKDEFVKRSGLHYAKKSIGKYFTELVQGGYLEVSDEKIGKKNRYFLTTKGAKKRSIDNLSLEPKWDNIIIPGDLKQELKNKDIIINSINDVNSLFEKPPWKDAETVRRYTRIIDEEED